MTTVGGFSNPVGMVFDGGNIWAANANSHNLQKLDGAGTVLQTVTLDAAPQYPVFDGSSIWAPTSASTVVVVRVSTGAILATLTGNGLSTSFAAAFDGERILVTNQGNNSVSLFKAADLSPIGNFFTGSPTTPTGAASDGQNFWVTLQSASKLAKF